MEIAKRLPHRSVQSVYRHGIRQLHPFKRGAWSEQETAVLVDLVQRMGKKWSAIQTKLNRSADACRDKYREMSDEYVKGRWKDTEMELLKRLVREHLNVDAAMDMKSLGILVEEQGIQIPWSTISKRIGKRSRLSCFKKWQKMAGLLSASEEVRRRKQPGNPAMAMPGNDADIGIGADIYDQSNKRQKVEGDDDDDDDDEVYHSAKMAEETVEAVDLPDVDGPTVHI
jgi:hypothetical protein